MYKITIERGEREGKLSYYGSASTVVGTACWWDLDKKIPAGIYYNCSATTMARKKNSSGGSREAIFIPNVTGFSGIFIHMGNNASWSDGCIVIKENELLRIYNDINPKNAENVTVVVRG